MGDTDVPVHCPARARPEAIPKGKLPKHRLTGIGRNCDLFYSMVPEVFRPKWADTLGAQGWSQVNG